VAGALHAQPARQSGPHGQSTMQDVKRLMSRMVEAFDTGNVSEVDFFVDPRYLDHQGVGGKPIRGPDGFRKVVDLARSGFADLRVSVEDMIGDSDRAAARLLWVGRRNSDGMSIRRETIDIVRFESGKAVEHWGHRTWIDLTE
jgi:predicted ester cyclase